MGTRKSVNILGKMVDRGSGFFEPYKQTGKQVRLGGTLVLTPFKNCLVLLSQKGNLQPFIYINYSRSNWRNKSVA